MVNLDECHERCNVEILTIQNSMSRQRINRACTARWDLSKVRFNSLRGKSYHIYSLEDDSAAVKDITETIYAMISYPGS